MAKFDWQREGPPRPSSASMDHPVGLERPYLHVTDAQKKQRRKELEQERKAAGLAIRALEWEERFGTPYPFSGL